MKKLGFGLMRLPLTDPSDEGSIDIEKTKRMVDIFLSKGFTYFDTAWLYCGFMSEPAAGECLVSRYPRESFQLATKLHTMYFHSRQDMDDLLDRQLEKTGAGYFDYYLLHGIEGRMLDKYERYGCFDWMKEKKQQGLVRHIGFSFHDTAETLEGILKRHPDMEFVQLQINYMDWENEYVQAHRCYELARSHGKDIIVMEPVKGGLLADIPAEAEALLREMDPDASPASWAVRFAASLPGVRVVLSGMNDESQVEDNTSYMEAFEPLTEDQIAVLMEAAEIIRGNIRIPCTACAYCTEGCPKKIAIPRYFGLYNEDMQEKDAGKWTPNTIFYDRVSKKAGKAGDCIECGRCEEVCPQHLRITELLKDVAAHFE